MEMKRETKTLKWYLKDFVRAVREEPFDWVLAIYVFVGCCAVLFGAWLGQVFIFLINNLVGV